MNVGPAEEFGEHGSPKTEPLRKGRRGAPLPWLLSFLGALRPHSPNLDGLTCIVTTTSECREWPEPLTAISGLGCSPSLALGRGKDGKATEAKGRPSSRDLPPEGPEVQG